jgi:hypothetical protein
MIASVTIETAQSGIRSTGRARKAADRLRDAGAGKDYRGRDKAGDHAPTWVEIE